MKRILFFFFVLASFVSQAQFKYQYLGAPKWVIHTRGHIYSDSSLGNANRDTTFTPYRVGIQVYRSADTSLYVSISTTAARKWWRLGSNVVSSGGSITANNGLTMSTATNAQLGGTLTQNTTIATTSSYFLSISGNNGNQSLQAANTGSGVGVLGSSTNGTAVYASSTSGVGLQVQTNGSALAADVLIWPSSTNTVQLNTQFQRYSTGTAADGIGQSIDFITQTTSGSGSAPLSNQLISKWTTANNATRTSQFSITGVDAATTKTLVEITGAGLFKLAQGAPVYADNAAATAGGLAAGTIYRTSTGQLMIVY